MSVSMAFTSIILPFYNIPLVISHWSSAELNGAVRQQLMGNYLPTDFYTWRSARQTSFLAGRAAVMQWQDKFAKTSFIVPKGQDGSPQWPAGWLGSISHCSDEAIAVLYCQCEQSHPVDLKGLGVDLENLAQANQLVMSADLLGTASEHLLFQNLGFEQNEALLAIFSIKESIYKAIYPALQRFVDFLEVEIVMLTSEGYWQARPLSPIDKSLKGSSELFGIIWQTEDKLYSIGARV
ncbi:4'-phosphopantetheinyl transferase family protein [Marinomonas fungiae]|uniref:4'-phosphopantetheinyl transferase family protein n=1 Tax=Marinomonas fungiae TaxID=1137284 RepID=UPI003A9216ED